MDVMTAVKECMHAEYELIDCEDSMATYKCMGCGEIKIQLEDCGSGG